MRDVQYAAPFFFCSGTTGNPKGVLYSHRAQMLHALLLVQVWLVCRMHGGAANLQYKKLG